MTQITFDSKTPERNKYALLHWIHNNHHPRITLTENHVVLDAPGYEPNNVARIPLDMWRELHDRRWITLRDARFDSRIYKVTYNGRRAAKDQGYEFGRHH